MERSIIDKKISINNLLVVGFLLIIYFTPLFCSSRGEKDFACILSFVVNGFIFIVGIFSAKNKHSVSMELIYWLFMFFFMYFAPVIQYRLNIFPWSTYIAENEILYANLIILLFSVCFVLGSSLARKVKIVGVQNFDTIRWLSSGFEIKKRCRVILSLAVFLLAIYSFSKTGLMGIVVPRAQAVQVFYSGQSSAVELIVESVVPAFITYVVADAAQSMMDKKEICIRFLLLFICLLICFFPTAIPRYKAATIYGVIFLVLFPWVNKGSRFFWLFTMGLFIVFPLLSAFRNVISHDSVQSLLNVGFFESYTEGDYDAYRMLVSSIRYIKTTGCTWGYQLLGVILFFIPSSIWSSKPIGSGAMLIKNELGSDAFANVSCPFIAEGLVNFGILGVILFALFLGVFISQMDKKYWNNFEKNNKSGLFSPYLFLVFMLFFVMRGDLLSGFAYVCGFIATGLILRIFAKRADLR